MFCELCKTRKLRREFPYDSITEFCAHAPLHCLRCLTKHVEKFNTCSQCPQTVTIESPQYLECVATLERLFPSTSEDATPGAVEVASEDGSQTISVVMLGGESTVVEYKPQMTIQALKSFIQSRLGPPPQKQRLLCNEKELKTYVGSKLTTLQDFAVQPFSTLHLIVILYEISESLDHVIFDLLWGYPSQGCDFLDASVLLYSGRYFQEYVDYGHRGFSGVYHSGDVMDHAKRLGHHTINVKLKSLPANIDKLFFTLSAWNSPNISKYKKPRLRFFDARQPNKQLCSDEMQHAAHSQAIIMCSLSKVDGAWKVFSLRTLSAGNAKNYSPLQQTISGIISQGLC